MKGISRTVLARDLAAQLHYAAQCAGRKEFWTEHEQAWFAAPTRREAEQAAEPALAICAGCPVIDLCEAWAATDKYTGLAAGKMWRNGASRSPAPKEFPLAS